MWKHAASLTAILLLVGACEGAVDTDGPLTFGGDSGTACLLLNEGRRFTIGGEVTLNTGTKPVTITSVTLVEPKDVTILETVIVPAPTPNESGVYVAIGFWNSYPPDGAKDTHEWKARQPAEGAQIPAGEERELIVGLTALGSVGTATAIEIEYKDSSGKRFVGRTTTKIVLQADCNNNS